jgi:hypothetical protein
VSALKQMCRIICCSSAGGTTGTAHVYNSRTGALVAQYRFGLNGKSLINDVVLTARGAYFTDSYYPDIYEIPIGPFGRLGRAVTIPLSGPAAAFSTAGLNLNGIAATADDNTLIVDNTVLDKLFTVNPVTGASAPINAAGLIPDSMDGLLLEGASLWVVENTANTLIRVTLSHDLSSGTITSTITSPYSTIPPPSRSTETTWRFPTDGTISAFRRPSDRAPRQGPPSTWS